MNLNTKQECYLYFSKSKPFGLRDTWFKSLGYPHQQEVLEKEPEALHNASVDVLQVIEYALMYVLKEDEDDVNHKPIMVVDAGNAASVTSNKGVVGGDVHDHHHASMIAPEELGTSGELNHGSACHDVPRSTNTTTTSDTIQSPACRAIIQARRFGKKE